MSYSSNDFINPIIYDKNIKIFDNNGNISYTIKPTFISEISTDVNFLKVLLKSGKLISLDFTNYDDAIIAHNKLQQQVSMLLQNNDYIDNVIENTSLSIISDYTYDTFLRPLTESDRNIKIYKSDLTIKYTIEPFNILNIGIYANLIKISLKSKKVISLEFSTSNESKLSLIKLKEQVDLLIDKVPLLIDKDIQNYIHDILNQLNPINYTFEYKSLGLRLSSNWQVPNNNSLINNTISTYPTLNNELETQLVLKTGKITKIVFKMLGRNPGIAINMDIYIGKFVKMNGDLTFGVETIIVNENITSLTLDSSECFIREFTILNDSITYGEHLYIAFKNNTGLEVTLFNPHIILIVE